MPNTLTSSARSSDVTKHHGLSGEQYAAFNGTPQQTTVGELEPGDIIAKARSHARCVVLGIQDNDASRWLELGTLEGNYEGSTHRIRPAHRIKVWRWTADDNHTTTPKEDAAMASKDEAAKATTQDQDEKQATNKQREAELKAAGLSTNAELTEKQAKRLNTIAVLRGEGKVPESLTGGKLATAIMKGTGMPSAKKAEAKAKRDSEAQRVLDEAVAIMGRAKGPLTRLEIEERLAKKGIVQAEGSTWRPSDTVCVAQVEGRVVNGKIITRPERGKYTVEEAPKS